MVYTRYRRDGLHLFRGEWVGRGLDAVIFEVGLGGRLDAVNVLDTDCAVITSIDIDHTEYLGDTREKIAFEKAGIARPGSPLVTQAYSEDVELEIELRAGLAGSPLHMRGHDWWAEVDDAIEYRDRHGELTLPLPALPGRHQGDNTALAVAMLRHQDCVAVSPEAMAEGIRADVLGSPIRVSTIYPGYIRSEMNDRVAGRTPLMVGTEKGVRAIVRAIERERATAAVPPWPWVPLGFLMRHAPLGLVRRLS